MSNLLSIPGADLLDLRGDWAAPLPPAMSWVDSIVAGERDVIAPAVSVDVQTVQTNLAYAVLGSDLDGHAAGAALERAGVRASLFGPSLLRFALRYAVDDRGVERTLDAMRGALAEGGLVGVGPTCVVGEAIP